VSCERARTIDLEAYAAEPGHARWRDFRAHFPGCDACTEALEAITAAEEEIEAAAGWEHPSAEALRAYAVAPGPRGEHPRSLRAGARIGGRSTATIEEHLGRCVECRDVLAALAAFRETGPARAEAPAAPPRSLAERLRAGWSDLLASLSPGAPAWAAVAAAIVAVVGAAWLYRSIGPESGADRYDASERVAQRSMPTPSAVAPGETREAGGSGAIRLAEPAGPAATDEEAITPAPAQTLAQQPTGEVPFESDPAEAPAPTVRPSESVAQADPPVEADPLPTQIWIAAALPSTPPLYDPDPLLSGGALDPIRTTAVVRSTGAASPTAIVALGPEHVGATAERQPTLYWFLESRSDAPVVITLIEDDALDPLLLKTLDPPIDAGLHALSLSEQGVNLAEGVTTTWYAAIRPDPDAPDADVVANAAVRWQPLAPARREELRTADPAQRAHLLASWGYWYDAFETLSAWIQDEPQVPVLRAHRRALLEQAGLPEVAPDPHSTSPES
jgi:hypothetical protein